MLIRLEYESCLLHATSTSAQYFLVQGSASLWILYLCLQLALAMRPPLKTFSVLIKVKGLVDNFFVAKGK